jgi:hypothetical protein
MSKLLLALNAALIALFVFALVSKAGLLHSIAPSPYLVLASILACTSVYLSNHRNFGFVALVFNGLLLIGGVSGLVGALLDIGMFANTSHRVAAAFSTALFVVVGAGNCRAIWRRFPKETIDKEQA